MLEDMSTFLARNAPIKLKRSTFDTARKEVAKRCQKAIFDCSVSPAQCNYREKCTCILARTSKRELKSTLAVQLSATAITMFGEPERCRKACILLLLRAANKNDIMTRETCKLAKARRPSRRNFLATLSIECNALSRNPSRSRGHVNACACMDNHKVTSVLLAK